MKKIFCLMLVLCLSASLCFGEPLKIERQNYIVQKSSRLYLLAPAFIFGAGSCVFTMNPIKDKSGVENYMPAVTCGMLSLLFFCVAFTPKVDYLIPVMDEDGTIWFEKEIRF